MASLNFQTIFFLFTSVSKLSMHAFEKRKASSGFHPKIMIQPSF